MSTRNNDKQAAGEAYRFGKHLSDAILRDSGLTLEEWVVSRDIQREHADELRGAR